MRKTGWTAKFHQCMIAKIMDTIIIMMKRKSKKKKRTRNRTMTINRTVKLH